MEGAVDGFGRVVKEEKKNWVVESAAGDHDHDDLPRHRLVKDHENEDKTSCSDKNDSSCTKTTRDDELESARAAMGEVREENQRLKTSLNRMMKDYESLRMQFLGIIGQEHQQQLEILNKNKLIVTTNQKEEEEEEAADELVSLTLGRFPFPSDHQNTTIKDKKPTMMMISKSNEESLSLGLDCKFERASSSAADHLSSTPTPKQSFDNNKETTTTTSTKEEAEGEGEGGTAAETWPPTKTSLKTMRSSGGDDEVTQQHNPPKKARVSVRARCETATMNDGCQWRKYGQKISKGNPCPRAYYRCTGSQSCPVRKQVQRCADDMSILITTYEGKHDHLLPVSATAMASTTSAAASMLLSGSSSSSTVVPNSSSSPAVNLNGLNFYLSGGNSNNPKQFYLPNSSMISTTSPTHPTITLDLTSSNPISASTPSHFSKFSSSFQNPRYPFTSSQLDFGSSRNNNLLPWNYNNNGVLSSYSNPANYNRSIIPTPTKADFYQHFTQKNNNIVSSMSTATSSNANQQISLPDTIAAATKAITADPSFQSALAAALSSIISNANGGGVGPVGGGYGGGAGEKLKARGDPALQVSSYTHQTTKGNNGCGTSYILNNNIAAAPTNSFPAAAAAGNLALVPPTNSLAFSSSNSKSASQSPTDHIDLTTN